MISLLVLNYDVSCETQARSESIDVAFGYS